MKKSLSLLVAIAMVFSMFATVAAAATTSEAKFEELKAAGIFDGMPDGSAGLDQEMTRAQFAKVIALLKGLTSNSKSVFTDVAEDHWAKGYIMAVYEAGIMEGVGNNKFAPSKNVTIQELLKVAVLVLGLEIDEDATVSGNASPWAQKYVAAAEKAGLIKPQADYTIPALRSVLVDVSYELYFEINGIPKVTGAEVVSSKKIVVTFSDGEQVEYELENALQPGANEVTVTYKDREYSVTVEYNAPAVDAKIVGAKKLEVAFNQAVDASKVKFTLKRGVNSVTIANTTWSDDKRTATLELASKFFEGDHELTVEGVDTEALKVSFKAEAERVAGIEILNDVVPVVDSNYDKLDVAYKVVNQYGEDITAITPVTGSSTGGNVNTTLNTGFARITAPQNVKFALDSTVVLTLIHASSNTIVTKNLKVGAEAKAAQVTIEGLHHDNNATLTTDATIGDFYLVVEVKDQYGNTIKNTNKLGAEVLVAVSNPAVASVAGYNNNKATFSTKNINGSDKTVLQLGRPANTPATAGTSVVTLIAAGAVGGTSATYTITVAEGLKADTIAIGDPGIIAQGETAKIPVVVTDLAGNEITDPSVLNNPAKGVVVNNGQLGGQFVKDSNGVYYQFHANTAGLLTLTAQTANNKFAIKTIEIRDAAVPAVITKLKDDVKVLIFKGQAVTLKPESLVVEDQYGRAMSDDSFKAALNKAALGAYKVVLSDTSSNYISLTGTELDSGTASVVVNGDNKGSETVSLKLQTLTTNGWEDVAGSQLTVTFRTVEMSELTSFGAEDIGKVYNNANYNVTLSVFGQTADGKKVTLPVNEYTAIPTNGNISVNQITKVVSVSGNADFTEKSELEDKVIITITATGDVIEKAVVATNVKPTVSVLEVRENGAKVTSLTLNNVTTLDIDAIAEYLYVKDQYGKEASVDATTGVITFKDHSTQNPNTVTPRITISGLVNAGGSVAPSISDNGLSTAKITGLEKGDSFTIVITAGSVSTDAIKVTIG